jgi:hypothetical protein
MTITARLDAHPGTIAGDPEELVHLDWSDEWRPRSCWTLATGTPLVTKDRTIREHLALARWPGSS